MKTAEQMRDITRKNIEDTKAKGLDGMSDKMMILREMESLILEASSKGDCCLKQFPVFTKKLEKEIKDEFKKLGYYCTIEYIPANNARNFLGEPVSWVYVKWS